MNSVLILSCASDFRYVVKENHYCRMLMDLLITRGISVRQIVLDFEELNNSEVDAIVATFDRVVLWVHRHNVNRTRELITQADKKSVFIIWGKHLDCIRDLFCSGIPTVIGLDLHVISHLLNEDQNPHLNPINCGDSLALISRCHDTLLEKTYIAEVLRRGGLAEVIRSMNCTRCSSCSKVGCIAKHSSGLHNADLLNELSMLQRVRTGKVSIIERDFFSNKETNEHLLDALNDISRKNNLKLSINTCYITILEHVSALNYISDSLYSLELHVNFDDPLTYHVLEHVRNFPVRIKLDFSMFSTYSTTQSLSKQLSYLERTKFHSSPDCIFKASTEPTEQINTVLNSWRLIYHTFLMPVHISLIDLENRLKAPFRNGISTQYQYLANIDGIVASCGSRITQITFDLLHATLQTCENERYDLDRTMISVVNHRETCLRELQVLHHKLKDDVI